MYYKATIDDNEGSKVYYDSNISSLKQKAYEEISKTCNHFFSVVYEDIDGYFDHEDVYIDGDGNIEEC